MPLQKAMVSSKTVEHITPQSFFKKLDDEFNFTLDPCSTDENHKCEKYYTIKDDGLSKDWSNEVVFMNPPYKGRTPFWIKKAYEESIKGATVVCLIAAGINRTYWHDIIFRYAAQIRWIRGCIKFEDAKSTAPFASAIVIFDQRREYLDKHVYNWPSK